MRLTFESDMVKGQCYRCPLWQEDYDEHGGWTEYCKLEHSVDAYDAGPDDCPLEEYQGIEWHPYPKEVPTQVGYYLVTMIPFGRKMVHVIPSNEFSQNPVIAWAELPKPYAN